MYMYILLGNNIYRNIIYIIYIILESAEPTTLSMLLLDHGFRVWGLGFRQTAHCILLPRRALNPQNQSVGLFWRYSPQRKQTALSTVTRVSWDVSAGVRVGGSGRVLRVTHGHCL
jgi:hypothetical protein